MMQQDEQHDVVWNRAVLGGIGICQGALLYYLREPWSLATLNRDTIAALQLFGWIAPLVAMLVIGRASWLKDALFAVAVGLVAAMLYKVSVGYLGFSSAETGWLRIGGGRGIGFSFAFGITCLILLVIPLPFYQAIRTEGRMAPQYRDLYLNAWTNKLAVLVACFFLGIAWAVLLLLAALFLLIKVRFFTDLFSENWFIATFTAAAFGLGVALARERQAAIQTLLTLIRTLFRVLAPILACVILMFLVALPFTGLETLWNTRIAARILLSALVVLIIFQNAVIQTAESDSAFWKPAEWAVMAANVALLVLAAMAAWAIFARVEQYGWTPARFYVALSTAVALAYALTYAGSVIVKRAAWTSGIARFNPILALVVLALSVLVHLPPLEPYGISARDQVARLRDGRIAPDAFDFAFLKFKLGDAGLSALKEIESDADLMKTAVVAERLEELKSFRHYTLPQTLGRRKQFSTTELRDVTAYMVMFPPERVPPAAAIAELVRNSRSQLQSCRFRSVSDGRTLISSPCAIIGGDLNSDGLEDVAILFQGYRLSTLLQQSDGSWKPGPVLTAGGRDIKLAPSSEIPKAIKRGDVQIVPPVTQDIMIGESRFR